ncbi:hypothetical protein Tco_0905669 [Tanacetum coccineum]
MGVGLRERLDLCLLSCSLVLIVLDSKYRDVLELPPNYDWQQLVVVLVAILYEGCVGRGPTSVLQNWLFSSPNHVLHGRRGLARSGLFRIAHVIRSCTKSSNEMISCTLKGKPLALSWGRTPRLDSGVRVSPILGFPNISLVSDSWSKWSPRTDNQEKDEKQSQNDKTRLGMEKTVKDKAKSKPESQSSQKVNRKVNWSKSSQPRGQSQRNISLGAEIAKP